MVDTYSATIDRSGDRPGARNVDGVPNRSVRGPVYRGARNHCRRLLTDPGSRQRLEHHCRRNVRSNKRPARRAGRDHWVFTFRIRGPVHISDFHSDNFFVGWGQLRESADAISVQVDRAVAGAATANHSSVRHVRYFSDRRISCFVAMSGGDRWYAFARLAHSVLLIQKMPATRV